jgi:predicted membrane protein
MSSRVGVWGTVVLRTSEFSVLHKGVAALAVFLQAQLRAWGLGVLRLVSDCILIEELQSYVFFFFWTWIRIILIRPEGVWMVFRSS